MKRRILTYITLSLLLSASFTSCVKDSYTSDDTTLKDQGTTYLRFFDGPEKATYALPFTNVKTVKLLEVRRDPNSNASLNSTISFNLVTTPALLDTYNEDHDTEILQMPSSLYTLTPGQSGIVATATGYTITLNSGELVKEIYINIDGSKWTDFGQKYGFSYAFGGTSGVGLLSGEETIVSFFGIQNAYQGTYASVGFFTHPVAASSRAIAKDKELVTISANSCSTELGDLGTSGYQMLLTVNPDNSVTISPLGATPATMRQDGVNVYDPAAKTFTLNYYYPGSGGNRVITEVLTLK
jgi:hypothetical protein